MKALVTGAGGFVGGHLVAHLRDHGDDVTALDREVDVTDAAAITRAVDAQRPDAVYHLAALSHVGDSWADPVEVFRVNAIGTLELLRACRAAGAQRILVVGTAEEYGAVDAMTITEDVPLRPHSPYAASKVAAEYLALQAFLGDGLPTLRVRAFNHTGPGQSDRFLVPALSHRIMEAERDARDEVLVGSLEPVRDLTDVRDVVRAYRLVVQRGTPGEVYNVCSGRGLSVREIAGRLIDLASRPLHLRVDPGLVRPVDVPRLVGDPSKLATDTGWSPEVSLNQTFADVLADAR
ncbi:MAG: GDP-mannose 4,6-dehydratase [Acidimicrobiia bacterium]